MSENDRYVIDILDVALSAIETMASGENESHSPSGLARHLDINRSRLFRILKTLERRGYVDYDPKTETYRLGLKFLTISQNIRDRLSLRCEAEDLLKKLAVDTGDCVHLIALSRNCAVVIDRYLGGNMLQVAAPIGEPLPLYIGAAPKLLLAYMLDNERECILNEITLTPYTPYTITDKDVLRGVLETIRQTGYSVDEQEFEIGVYAFGAPIFDNIGSVVAGISITVPAVRYDLERRERLIQVLLATAQAISNRLGYQGKLIEKPYSLPTSLNPQQEPARTVETPASTKV
jgi:DNA-binding IclR family transcriptional regulator